MSVLFFAGTAVAQTTSFTYQGRLTDGGTAANGNYDLQFALFDGGAGGNQIGATQTLNTVAVNAGIFTVNLDFGVNAFPGANRFLEIGVRPAGGGAFTTLAPRQQISSTPYAIRTLSAATADTATNATQLGGVAASQYVQTIDSRLSDSRPPSPGSSNYIQNTTSPQAGSNFNIGGNGTAGSLDVNGALSLRSASTPGVAPPGQGRLYYDSAANKIKVSQNGNAFVDLIGVGGLSGSGSAGAIPRWSSNNGLDNSVITQSSERNVGIDTITSPGFKLEVGTGYNKFGFVHSGSFVGPGFELITSRLGSYIGNSQSSAAIGAWFGTLTNDPLHLFVNNGQPALTVDSPTGNVGIGTFTPQFKLDVAGSTRVGSLNVSSGATLGGSLTVNSNATVNGNLTLNTAGSSYGLIHAGGGVQMGTFIGPGQVNPAGGWLGTKSNHPLYFFTNNNAASMTIDTSGNISQPRSNNGLPKAMVYLNRDGTIGRCYNGITGSSGDGCGFTSTHPGLGDYLIDFGFPITDRFIVATSMNAGGDTVATLSFVSANVLEVSISYISNTNDVGALTNAPFFVIVY